MARRRIIPAGTRAEVARRLGAKPTETHPVRCHYCGASGFIKWFFWPRDRYGSPATDLEWDHVVPVSRGGSNSDPDNIVVACFGCNRSKGCKDADVWEAGTA